MLSDKSFPKGLTVEQWLPEHDRGFVGLESIRLDDDGDSWVDLNAQVLAPDIQGAEGVWIAVRRAADDVYELDVPELPDYLRDVARSDNPSARWAKARLV